VKSPFREIPRNLNLASEKPDEGHVEGDGRQSEAANLLPGNRWQMLGHLDKKRGASA